MKACSKCHRLRDISDFYPNRTKGDGHLSKCKDCSRSDAAKYRAENRSKVRERDREYSKTEACRERRRPKQARKRAEVGPSYDRAHNAIARAIKSGDITRPKICDRCPATERIQAHHDDYDRPLDVMWLCVLCHAARHRELGRLRTIDRVQDR